MMTSTVLPVDTLLRPGQAADLLGVNVKTLARWERTGRVHAIRTAGGHRRYHEHDIRELLATRLAAS